VVNESPQGSEATAVIPATVELPAEAQPEEKAKQETSAAAAGLVAAAAAAEAAKLTAPPAAPEPEAEKSEPVEEPAVPVEEPSAAAPTPAAALQEVVAPPPAEPQDEKRRKFPLVPIAIVLLVLAVGVGSFLLWPKDKGQNAQSPTNPASSGTSAAPTTSQTQPQTQTTTTQTTTEPPAQTTTNPPANPPNPPASTQTAAQALEAYYALVPGNLEAGYATLTDSFKAAMVPTFQEYQTFWRRFTSVQLSNVTQQGDNVVSATLQYLQGSTVTNTERNTYTLVQQNGKWMIDKQVSG
jgi:hypothetical protein